MTGVGVRVDALLREVEYPDIDAVVFSLVAEWIDNFFELVHAADTSDPQLACDLVAAWMRLWRTKPSLIKAVTQVDFTAAPQMDSDYWSVLLGVEDHRQYELMLRRRICELVELALSVPKPLAWIAELDELAETVVEDGQQETQWAVELLDDYDTACLVCAASEWATGGLPPELRRQMQLAGRALVGESETFVIVPEFVLAVAHTVDYGRPLPSALKRSGEWSVIVLEQLVRLHKFIRGDESLPRAQLQAAEVLWHAEVSTWLARYLAKFLQFPSQRTIAQTSVLLAAAPAGAELLTLNQLLRWVSPDGSAMAIVDLPTVSADQMGFEWFPVRFCEAILVGGQPIPGPPLTGLHSVRVQFCGIQTAVDREGKAAFPSERLREALQGSSDLDLILHRPSGPERWSVMKPFLRIARTEQSNEDVADK